VAFWIRSAEKLVVDAGTFGLGFDSPFVASPLVSVAGSTSFSSVTDSLKPTLFRASEEREIVGGANAFEELKSSSNAGIVENLIFVF
jgi:hypothetical protein